MEDKKTKRKYVKHKTEKKLGIRHYINTKLPMKAEGVTTYPLYVQLTYKGKTIRIKSETNAYWYDNNFEEVEDIQSRANWEKEKITYCFNNYLSSNIYDDANLSDLITFYNQDYKKPLLDLINEGLYNLITHQIDIINLEQKTISIEEYIYSLTQVDSISQENHYLKMQKVSSYSILALYSELFPSLEILKESYSSHIWFFDAYYYKFQYKLITSNPRTYHEYTKYECQVGIFQKEFLNAFENTDTASAIIKDIEKLLKI